MKKRILEAYKKFLSDGSNQMLQGVYTAASKRLSTDDEYFLPAQFVEKDFWVCLVLDILFNSGFTGQYQLLFKGGTALSKSDGLIKRFSEDIDIVLFRADLGYAGDKDPTIDHSDLSKKQRSRLLEQLTEKSSGVIHGELKSLLVKELEGLGCDILPHSTETQTLMIKYKSVFDSLDYVQPIIKLEAGARSALEPNKFRSVKPYISDVVTTFNFEVPNVLTIDPKRTFLDKLLILHGLQAGYQGEEKKEIKDGNRLSRHYYDVAMLAQHTEVRDAIYDHDLLDDVRKHSTNSFGSAWRKLELATPETIEINPCAELAEALRKDYELMGQMIIGKPPAFADILDIIEQIQQDIRPKAIITNKP